jgi:hypothetical protein
MGSKVAVLILAVTVVLAAVIVRAEARAGSNGGTQRSATASSHSLQTHTKPKVKNFRGKRNPSDQGREH